MSNGDDGRALPFGLSGASLKAASLQSISQQKLAAFTSGRMNAARKKTPFELKKEREEKKAKDAEREAAKAFGDFAEYFADDGEAGPSFVSSEKSEAKDKGVYGRKKMFKPPSMFKPPPSAGSSLYDSRNISLKEEQSSKKSGKGQEKSSRTLLLEKMKAQQEERKIRHELKKAEVRASGGDVSKVKLIEIAPDPAPQAGPAKGSFDNGDSTTTNLYVGNLSPDMDEGLMCQTFGVYGPLASVKIMWPRTQEEKMRGRMCGFVAFMKRPDGQKAIEEMTGKLILGFEIKLGWGKPIPIPPRPFYVHHASKEGLKVKTDLPFNAQAKVANAVTYKNSSYNPTPLQVPGGDGSKLSSTVVMVVIPADRELRTLIHRTVEFVIKHGPSFEALLISRCSADDKYKFICDYKNKDHVYYRWKLFSILQGDRVSRWNMDPFRMFEGGSEWHPPKPDQIEKLETVEKGHLSITDRDKLIDQLQHLTPERHDIAKAMVFCLKRAECADDVAQLITESLETEDASIVAKISRLFLVSDILHNCSAPVRNASAYRMVFETRLPGIFKALHVKFKSIESRLRAEQFRKSVFLCLNAWRDWSIFAPQLFIELEALFRRGTTEAAKPQSAAAARSTGAVLPNYAGQDDDSDDDLDGVPLTRPPDPANNDAFSSSDDDDLDGVPLTAPAPAPTARPAPASASASTAKMSKWERMDMEDEVDSEPKRFRT